MVSRRMMRSLDKTGNYKGLVDIPSRRRDGTLLDIGLTSGPDVAIKEPVMPEYLSPGVYVEEIPLVPTPIAGVSTGSSTAASESPKRPSYFGGQLLDASTLQAEQDYFRGKLRRHNRHLHGFGIVSGLGVNVSPPDDQGGSRIVVEPGYAIDPQGEEIALPNGATLELAAGGEEAFLTLRFWEHPCPGSSPVEGDYPCSPMVEEACLIGVRSDIPASALAIARLLRRNNYWIVDPEFAAARVLSGRSPLTTSMLDASIVTR